MDASPVQHIQDVHGNPSCDGDFTRNGVRKKGSFLKKEKSVDFRTEDYTQPEFSQYSRYSQPTDNTRNKSDIEETSVWRPFVVIESNTGYIDPQLGRRSVVSEEGIRLANFRHRPCISPPGRSVKIDRGYGDSARVDDAFIPCRDRFYPSHQDNPVYRSSGDVSGYRRGFGGTSYVVEDPSLDPYTTFERQGPGPQLVGLDPRPNYNVDSSVSAGIGYNPPVQAQQNTGLTSSPYRIDTEVNASDKSPRGKQKEPDKYDGKKVEWQDFQVHFETVAAWNGWTNTEKGLQLATCLRGKAQKVLSELKPSQKSDYQTLTNVLFSPPHRESAFRAVLRQRQRLPKESLMDYGCEVSRLAQKAYPEFPYEALDQVSREQFVRGLSDIDMKRYRSPKHDQAREHSRNALCHHRLSKAERIARTEHMPWIQAENPDYVPVRDTDVPPLPRNPEGGKILDPEPKPLPFAAKASPIVGIEAERRRCGMVKHVGEYVAVRPNPATHDTHKARPMPLPTEGVRDGVFSSRDIRRGVVRSGSTPETATRPTVETHVHRAHHEPRPMLGRPSPQALDAYRKEEEEIRGEMAQIRQEMDLLRAREALLRRRQE